VESVDHGDAIGIGVRALIGSSWGFYATADLTISSASSAGRAAAEIACASTLVAGPPMELAHVEKTEASYETPFTEDPFGVSLGDKVELLLAATSVAMSVKGVALASANLSFWDTNKWFASSQGSRIHQHLVESMTDSVERGLYVSTLNYCRVLDPKTLVVTGLTRNGTFMIENGAISGAVTNMRFTQSVVDALAKGSLLSLGNDGRYADSEFGAGVVYAPTVRLARWNFTGGAAG
jgi:predicted Zn-dependent protease